ncbi:hypothetical protein [Algihabitans albus]|uniref:hypothetical protein n=1 Tax=Algihabitans albus TaxID=2164067 RepID=UPI000E5D26FE|nr:hypothetical protein [Algihabitans albus]
MRLGDGVYVMILGLMVANVMVGAVLALVGEQLLGSPAVSLFGTWLAAGGGLGYLFFRWLGSREQKKRSG